MGKIFKSQVDFEGGLKISDGVLSLNERSHTPGHDIGEIKVYGKTDNKLYYISETGTEFEIGASGGNYLEVYIVNNTVATTIETANTPICLSLAATTEGEASGTWTFIAGSAGAITAYADYSGTVTGAVSVLSPSHGLATDDYVSIRGTTNYNGVFQITVIDADYFYIIDTWVADDGNSDWDSPDHAVIGAESVGKYKLSIALSVSEQGAAGSTVTFMQYLNGVEVSKCTAERKFTNNDVGAIPMNGILNLSSGDVIFLATASTGTNTITFKRMNLTLTKI